MAFFQTSVINKYLKTLDKATIAAAYARFKSHFHNPAIQENIRNSKEEQYQGEFLLDLFVNVLGYTKNPTPNYNLTTEHKNVKDSKKADGAILINDAVKAVIELKGTNTTDLSKIEDQAFGYKNNQPGCVYVVTSNFEKLRFYVDNAVEHLEFNLFTLTEKEFALLYLCLAYESIAKGTPKKLKDESVSQEDVITKQLYKDYSLFKRELHQSLVSLNPQFEPLELFKKSQKLLDRFLFLFFAEDRQLLPPNSVRLILSQWRTLQDLDVEIPLYDRFKLYFGYLNTGHKGKQYDVFAYNGGLFKADDILDNIIVDDELLYKHALKLSEYDFASEVDVNILGHIFENSLNELDEIKAQLDGQTIDKASTKRKKDGVFYTPKYITKYIVENTVGKLCAEKKAELQLNDEDYSTDKKRQLKTRKALDDKLKAYRAWLLQLTICDPACGSGAFLNQALDFLITEHRYLDELQTKLMGYSIVLSDVEKSILENNLFGVDLNEESVEIAKLSLWLRTAQPNRKLNDLNNNIKCGNSLIDDPIVAGDKAFNWQQAFPQVFEKGGFDVVIGNPPYVQSHSLSEKDKSYIYDNYKTTEYQINTYGVFVEKFINLLKSDALYSLIIPNYWLSTKYDRLLRREVFINNHALEVVNTYEVFESATVDTLILTGRKIKLDSHSTRVLSISSSHKTIENRLNAINLSLWDFEDFKVFSERDNDVLISFYTGFQLKGEKALKDFLVFKKGMQPYEAGKGTPPQTREMMNNKVYHSLTKLDDTYFPLLGAKHIKRFNLQKPDEFIKYGKNLAAPRKPEIFQGDRILINRILSNQKIDGVLVSETFINNTDVFNLIPKSDSIIDIRVLYLIIVSGLCASYFKSSNINLNRAAYPKINVNTLENFPVPAISPEAQQPFIEKADAMLSLNEELQTINQKFQRTLGRKFGLTELPKKLQEWYLLSYGDFIKELAKKKVKLSLSDEAKWEDYFTQEAEKALALKTNIATTDAEIDQLVYQLYNLTDEEIAIVEGKEVLATAEL
ncbi:Eco57I restriction-modification methylase domain-containing protein [Pontibacter fetidus]|uniref:site-specific DNA-methyltransferase (adenine-specific) n=1 Tax=Pontibacter fetidus TaxID=2700082 RepID=A0A6B2GZS1_9BACT|nr:DNA methyltransferase [Pontibacter fetidus]NDK55541.1 N-6 DNA methylase [Pontibacter fetidus]